MPEELRLPEGHILVLVLVGSLGRMQLAVAVLACTAAAAAWEPDAAYTAVEVDTLHHVLPAEQQVHLRDPFYCTSCFLNVKCAELAPVNMSGLLIRNWRAR